MLSGDRVQERVKLRPKHQALISFRRIRINHYNGLGNWDIFASRVASR